VKDYQATTKATTRIERWFDNGPHRTVRNPNTLLHSRMTSVSTAYWPRCYWLYCHSTAAAHAAWLSAATGAAADCSDARWRAALSHPAAAAAASAQWVSTTSPWSSHLYSRQVFVAPSAAAAVWASCAHPELRHVTVPLSVGGGCVQLGRWRGDRGNGRGGYGTTSARCVHAKSEAEDLR